MAFPSQYQHYWSSQRKIADVNETFLFLVANGLTREDLAANIKRRPALWGRFEHWLDKLGTNEKVAR